MQSRRRAQIALVLQLLVDAKHGRLRQQGVVKYGSLADGTQHAVEPPGGVTTSQRIGVKGNLHCREPSGVASLAHKSLQVGRHHIAQCRVGDYLHAVQQIAALSDVFRL